MPACRLCERRQLVGAVLARNLHLRPFAPQVDARRRFDDVDDEGAADARRGLEKVQLAVGAADELGVGDAAPQPERRQDLRVHLPQRRDHAVVCRQRARDEDAALVRDRHRRRRVAADHREHRLGGRTRSSRRGRRRRARTVRAGSRHARRRASSMALPELVGAVQLLDADGRGLRPRLQHPRRRDAARPLADRCRC